MCFSFLLKHQHQVDWIDSPWQWRMATIGALISMRQRAELFSIAVFKEATSNESVCWVVLNSKWVRHGQRKGIVSSEQSTQCMEALTAHQEASGSQPCTHRASTKSIFWNSQCKLHALDFPWGQSTNPEFFMHKERLKVGIVRNGNIQQFGWDSEWESNTARDSMSERSESVSEWQLAEKWNSPTMKFWNSLWVKFWLQKVATVMRQCTPWVWLAVVRFVCNMDPIVTCQRKSHLVDTSEWQHRDHPRHHWFVDRSSKSSIPRKWEWTYFTFDGFHCDGWESERKWRVTLTAIWETLKRQDTSSYVTSSLLVSKTNGPQNWHVAFAQMYCFHYTPFKILVVDHVLRPPNQNGHPSTFGTRNTKPGGMTDSWQSNQQQMLMLPGVPTACRMTTRTNASGCQNQMTHNPSTAPIKEVGVKESIFFFPQPQHH